MNTFNNKRAIAWTVGALSGALALSRFLRSLRAIDFADKSVLIFGGSRGLGLVLAREFVAEGARVTIAARDQDELERAQSELRNRGSAPSIVCCDRPALSADAACPVHSLSENCDSRVAVNTAAS